MFFLGGRLIEKLKYLSIVLTVQYEQNWNLLFEIKATVKCSNYF